MNCETLSKPWGEGPRDEEWERHLRGGFGSCSAWDAAMNCPDADGLWGFLLLFSFLLGCGVNFAQLTLEVGKGGKGGEEEREPVIRTSSQLRGWDHKVWTVGAMLTVWGCFGKQKQFCLCYIKRSYNGTKAELCLLFSQIPLISLLKTQPSQSTPHKQVVSEAQGVLRMCTHPSQATHPAKSSNQYCAASPSVWPQVQGRRVPTWVWFLLDPWNSSHLLLLSCASLLKLYFDEFFFRLKWAKPESGSWRKYSSAKFLHIIMTYRREREESKWATNSGQEFQKQPMS